MPPLVPMTGQNFAVTMFSDDLGANVGREAPPLETAGLRSIGELRKPP
jgi:hypothetical protein